MVITTVNNSVAILQEALSVDVTLDMSCWLMAMSVKVLVHKHPNPHTTHRVCACTCVYEYKLG